MLIKSVYQVIPEIDIPGILLTLKTTLALNTTNCHGCDIFKS